MDFSDNLDYNNKLDNGFEIDIYNQNSMSSEKIIDESKNINSQHKSNVKIDDDKEEKEAYKSLLKLSDFLYYHLSKNENNIITLKGKSKTNKKQLNKDKEKKKSSIISNNDNIEENIDINMLDDKDILYMWYMEEKKNKNKSFNYQVDDDYEELFSDSYI